MPPIDLSVVPSVIHRDGPREYHTDIYSRMLKERVIFLTGPVHDQMADVVIAQLLYLEFESPTSDVQVYINSPGGSVSAGLAIHDVMQMLRCDVVTHCVGQAASMGAFLLAAGTPGKRYALPHARVMIHQPLIGGGGITGQATDVLLHAAEMKRTRDTLDGLLSGYTGKPLKTIRRDTERDNFMSALEAKNYGLIDHVLTRQDRPK